MKKFKRAAALAAAAVMAASALAGCGSAGSGKSSDKYYIGGIGPVTGDAAVYGTAVKNGAQIAFTQGLGNADPYGNSYNYTLYSCNG